MKNRDLSRLVDGLCGRGGIHCPCCHGVARKNGRKDPAFGRRIRAMAKVFVAKDTAKNPS